MGQSALQAALPTGAAVMQIGAAPRHLSAWIDLDSFRGAHNADQRPLG
jgi:hypothetical protein